MSNQPEWKEWGGSQEQSDEIDNCDHGYILRSTDGSEGPIQLNSPTSGLIPTEKKFYDFDLAIKTIIKFVDKELNDSNVDEHIKTDLRVFRATINVFNANYPFTKDPNNTDTMERKFRRQHALSNMTGQIATIALDDERGKFDQKRTSN